MLCRGPDAVALSEDHKPASEAEKARIMAAGGFISDVGGVIRQVAPPVAAFPLTCSQHPHSASACHRLYNITVLS